MLNSEDCDRDAKALIIRMSENVYRIVQLKLAISDTPTKFA